MNVSKVTDEDFDTQVWVSPSICKGGAVAVVLFTKPSADGSKKASERMSDLVAEVAGGYDKLDLKFFEVDFIASPNTAKRFDVQSAPTLLLLQFEEIVGGMMKDTLVSKIDKKLS